MAPSSNRSAEHDGEVNGGEVCERGERRGSRAAVDNFGGNSPGGGCRTRVVAQHNNRSAGQGGVDVVSWEGRNKVTCSGEGLGGAGRWCWCSSSSGAAQAGAGRNRRCWAVLDGGAAAGARRSRIFRKGTRCAGAATAATTHQRAAQALHGAEAPATVVVTGRRGGSSNECQKAESDGLRFEGGEGTRVGVSAGVQVSPKVMACCPWVELGAGGGGGGPAKPGVAVAHARASGALPASEPCRELNPQQPQAVARHRLAPAARCSRAKANLGMSVRQRCTHLDHRACS